MGIFEEVLESLKDDPRYICVPDDTHTTVFQERGRVNISRMAAFLENLKDVREDFLIVTATDGQRNRLIPEMERLGLDSLTEKLVTPEEIRSGVSAVVLLGNADYAGIVNTADESLWYSEIVYLLTSSSLKEKEMITNLDRVQKLTRLEALDERFGIDYGIRQTEIKEGIQALKEGSFPRSALYRADNEGLAEEITLFKSLYEDLAINGSLKDPFYRDHYIYLSSILVSEKDRNDYIRKVFNFYENQDIVSEESRRDKTAFPFEIRDPLENFLKDYESEDFKTEIRETVRILKNSPKTGKLLSPGLKYKQFYDLSTEILVRELVKEPVKFKNLLDTSSFILFLGDLFNHREILES